MHLATVQSCWNGIAVLDPAPFYNIPHVQFRMARLAQKECSASECGLICSEFLFPVLDFPDSVGSGKEITVLINL